MPIISLKFGGNWKNELSVELTGNNRPEYGKKVVAEVSKRLEDRCMVRDLIKHQFQE